MRSGFGMRKQAGKSGRPTARMASIWLPEGHGILKSGGWLNKKVGAVALSKSPKTKKWRRQ
ncbi:MAG: hypothetical protein LBR56_06650 [Sporomusaceae bacterium]|nr:hypothetical protein [Sporomusaceae bacterium]